MECHTKQLNKEIMLVYASGTTPRMSSADVGHAYHILSMPMNIHSWGIIVQNMECPPMPK